MTGQSTPTLTIAEFKGTRETRRDVLLVEYRELVQALVKGISAKSKQASRLDDIMVRLNISDDALATDVDAVKQHARLSQSIAEFQAKKPQLDKKCEKWTKAIDKVRKEMEAIERRLVEAQRERHLAGQPHNHYRADVTRKQALESHNTRMFGTPENA